ncbi:MAG TPA: hypothetical protein VHV55_24260 [Pirellulales bacterium]|jgi:hypothetical protein|nr:hypothetical protein [Pirellulales bacterium]
MPVDLVYGSSPGADDVLQGAEAIAQQTIQRQQLANQMAQALMQHQTQQSQLGLEAQRQAFAQNMAMAPYNTAAENALWSFLNMDPTAMAGGYSGLAGVGAGVLGASSLGAYYAPQGDYDSAGGQKPNAGQLSTAYNQYAGQGWMGGVTGADAIYNNDEDDSGEGMSGGDE